MVTETLDEEAIDYFLNHQDQLFSEPVCGNAEEAEDFLTDCLAVICDTEKEVAEYLGDSMDIDGMAMDELLQSPEVFSLDDGRYLVVEG